MIKEIINNEIDKRKINAQTGKVISIDEEKRQCEIELLTGDANRNFRLQASLSLTEGLYIKPKIESFVSVVFLNKITGIIVQYSEIDSIELTTDTDITVNNNGLTVYNTEGGIELNDNTGVQLNVTVLNITQGGENIEDLFEKQRAIQDDINALKDVFKNWTPVTTDGGAALKAAAATWFAQPIEIIT